MNLKEIKELIKMLGETDITELKLESEGVKVAIRKGGAFVEAPAPVAAPAPQKAVEAPTEAPVVAPELARNENLVAVTAPMVGTFYRSPAPDAPSFVEVGTVLAKGQGVCIIEAMKLMNEIEADMAGKVVEILVENGQPVEYGQTLFLVEPV